MSDSVCPMCAYDFGAVVTSRWQVTIPMALMSQNQLKGNGRHDWKYKAFRNKAEALLSSELELNKVPAADRARRGIITRWYGKGRRKFDQENVVGGSKPLLDVMQNLQLIINDNTKYWQGFYKQRKSPDGQDYITIELEELEGVERFA